MSRNEAWLCRCPKCNQNLYEMDTRKCYGCGHEEPRADYYEEWVNKDDPWYEDPFEDLD